MEASVLVHVDRICDGSGDCPDGSDDADCLVTCAAGFQCIGGFVVVDAFNILEQLTNLSFIDPRTRMIDFSNMNVSSALSTTSDLALSNLLDLRLSNCFLTDLLVPFKKFDRLSKLDVSYDLFRNITHNGSDIRAIYSGGHSLRLLHLSFNALLTLIEVDTLSNNLNLRVLDLSLTALATFSNTSRIIHDLMHLNLSYTRIKFIGDFIIPIDHKAWHLEIIDLRGVEIDKVRCFVFTGLIVSCEFF